MAELSSSGVRIDAGHEALALPGDKVVRYPMMGRIAALGAVNRTEGPESFRRWLDAEIEVWAAVVRANNIRLD